MKRKLYISILSLFGMVCANTAMAKIDPSESDLVYPRKMVVEEWTGTWCGMCVRGIVGMDYMEKNYGHENFIGIAVHSNDMMEAPGYNDFRANYILTSYPGSIVNRKRTADPDPVILERLYKSMADEKSYAMVKAQVVWPEDEAEAMEVTATVRVSIPIEDSPLQLSFAITEDNFGRFAQNNGYSGGIMGPMYGWEKEKGIVMMAFDHVLRDAVGCLGVPGSLPSSLEADTDYIYTINFPLTRVKTIDEATLNVLLLDTETGEIVNADKVKLVTAGIEGPSAVENMPTVYSIPQGIGISGDHKGGRVYTVDGRLVKTVTSEKEVALPAGMYIVTLTSLSGTPYSKKLIVR